MRTVLGAVAIVVAVVLLLAALYAGNIAVGMHSTATVNGTIAGTGVSAPVQILRDARGVPHIRAADDHDVFFAEGYVRSPGPALSARSLAPLRLRRAFRRSSATRVVASDEKARVVPVRAIVDAQWHKTRASGSGQRCRPLPTASTPQ